MLTTTKRNNEFKRIAYLIMNQHGDERPDHILLPRTDSAKSTVAIVASTQFRHQRVTPEHAPFTALA